MPPVSPVKGSQAVMAEAVISPVRVVRALLQQERVSRINWQVMVLPKRAFQPKAQKSPVMAQRAVVVIKYRLPPGRPVRIRWLQMMTSLPGNSGRRLKRKQIPS